MHARSCVYIIGVPKKVMETSWMVLFSSNANLKDLYWINFSDFFYAGLQWNSLAQLILYKKKEISRKRHI